MRFSLIFIAGLAMVTPVAAQQQQPSEYVLKITPAELDQIGKALGLMPYNDVAQTVQKLRQQVVDQQQPKKVEEPKQ
ncbi:MAG TPA: hypothetical protein PLN40_10195 [Agitococcus sp.]|nr:hypothetical protein [Agitococcus sp.]HNB01947.1 hypothetical protein [Nitrosomonas sp.]